jgi:MFS transporter, DHA3 family, macrolide efflux protein
LRHHAALLRAAAEFRLLFVATLGSNLGTWMATIALTVDVQSRTQSAWWVSALLAVTLLPTVLIGLAVGPVIDSVSRKGLLVGADLVRLGVFAALPFVNSAALIIVLAGVAGIANSFFRPAVLAGLPNLVSEQELARGTSLLQTADWTATAVGPVVAGAIVGASGPHLVYWINAATFLFSAVLVLRIAGGYLQSERGITRGYWRDLREGVGEFRISRPLQTAFFALGFAAIGAGLINVSEIFLARRSLHAGAFGYGLLWTAAGVGLMSGSLLVGSLLERRTALSAYPWMFLPWAAGTFGAAVAPNIWVAAVAMVVSGMGNGLTFPTTVVIVQQATVDTIRGRVFTVIISAHNALLGVAFAAAGGLTGAFGARWVFGAAAALSLVGGVAAFGLTGRNPARIGVRHHEQVA